MAGLSKKASWLINAAWFLVGLLGLSAALITSGSSKHAFDPTIGSYSTSGTAALADLLRVNGYQVVEDSHSSPKIARNDVVAAFQAKDHDDEPTDSKDVAKRTADSITASATAGATVFWLPLNEDFDQQSTNGQPASNYTRLDKQTRALTGSDQDMPSVANSVDLLSGGNGAMISADSIGKGYEIRYADASGLTNRFLDEGQNAQTFLEILKAYAPEAKRVVFPTGTLGAVQQTGFLESLGPWAEGSWYQLLFLILIIVLSLNQRFGLPIRMRRVQVGGRELVDAFADTMFRAHAVEMGLQSAYDSSDQQIRSLIRMPRDASEGERDRLIPSELLNRLNEVKAASQMPKVRPADALNLIVKLDREISTFHHELKGTETSRPRRRNR